MMMFSDQTLQMIYFVCSAVLFILFIVAIILFLRFMVKWTKVADLLNRKIEGNWKFFDVTKLAALKGVVTMALPYLVDLFKKMSRRDNSRIVSVERKTKTKK
ncbi:MAG: hypothetical protein V1902_02290 [Candidatus Falkowbacteria bacterium]